MRFCLDCFITQCVCERETERGPQDTDDGDGWDDSDRVRFLEKADCCCCCCCCCRAHTHVWAAAAAAAAAAGHTHMSEAAQRWGTVWSGGWLNRDSVRKSLTPVTNTDEHIRLMLWSTWITSPSSLVTFNTRKRCLSRRNAVIPGSCKGLLWLRWPRVTEFAAEIINKLQLKLWWLMVN